MLVDLIVKCAPANAENQGGLFLVAVERVEGSLDKFSFDRSKGCPGGDEI